MVSTTTGIQEFSSQYEGMDPAELNKCLQQFYISARKKDGSYYNKKWLTAIRAVLDRHFRSQPHYKPFSIIGDSQSHEANQTLSSFVKNLGKAGGIVPTVQKRPLIHWLGIC